jgi:hypothetical protein
MDVMGLDDGEVGGRPICWRRKWKWRVEGEGKAATEGRRWKGP